METRATGHVRLADGRRLDMRDTGPRTGDVVLLHPGTPMGAARLGFIEDAAHARGLRFVVVSRPGYGDSTRLPGRAVAHAVADTAELLDALAVDRLHVIGYSGGGPHALACAARLDGVRGAAVIGGVAPRHDGFDWFAGMGEANVHGFTTCIEGGEPAMRAILEQDPDRMQSVTVDQMVQQMDSLLPDVDRALLSEDLGADILGAIQEAYRVGVDGTLDDNLSFVSPWGFGLDEIGVPVDIWHGTVDRMSPVQHGRYLAAQVPTARAHVFEGEGHISVLVGMIDTILDRLCDTPS